VWRRNRVIEMIQTASQQHRWPEILSPEEVQRLFEAALSFSHLFAFVRPAPSPDERLTRVAGAIHNRKRL
jgi:hypothetical protein